MDKHKDELRSSCCMATAVTTEDMQHKLDSHREQHLPVNPIFTMAFFTHVVCTGIIFCCNRICGRKPLTYILSMVYTTCFFYAP